MSDQKSSAENSHDLHQCDFDPLITKLTEAHFPGTREWLFDEVRSWLRVGTQRLLWLEGAAGTGKSVVSAKLLRTVGIKERIVAWHFCRHDNAAGSSVRTIVESWASMLCLNVQGFMVSEDARSRAYTAATAQEIFELLISVPLKVVPEPKNGVIVFLLDALDELPRDSMIPVLEFISNVFQSLPSFVRLFVTSRAENEIKTRLRRFQPVEIVVNELRNRADVRAYLVHVAREYFKMELSSTDLEGTLEMQFGLRAGALKDQLSGIQQAIQLSRSVYNDVIDSIKHDSEFKRICSIADRHQIDLFQSESTLEVLYEDAKEAREKVLSVFASEWEEFKRIDEGRTVLSRPTAGKAAEWVDNAIDPGLKGRESALRKINNEYANDARRMKDLVRFTVECENSRRMSSALARMQEDKTFDVVMLRNKYATPTLLGYCDFNLSIRVKLNSGRSHICEVQINLKDMVKAKELAHVHYEKVRSEIPVICDRVGIVREKDRARFESCLLRMLRRSALDAAVEQLEARTGGLFLYATLLARELQLEPGLRDFSKLQSLPNGLGEIYKANFDRMVGQDEAGWAKYRRVVSMIIATREPLPEGTARQILGADFEGLVGPLSVLFPCRDGRFEVMHKSVADWLNRVDHEYSLTSHDAETAHKDLAVVFLRLSREYSSSRILDMDYGAVSPEISFALRQAIYHLCSAGMLKEAHELVTNFEWLLARVATGKPAVLMLDVESLDKISPAPLTKLIASTLRLALTSLTKNWRLLASQLVGRLLGHIAKDEVWSLLQHVCQWRGPSEGWWCFIQPTLSSAGGNHISTFFHEDGVQSVKWNSGGNLICTGSAGGKVRIWSTENSECLQTLSGHTSAVTSVSWNSDSSKICTGSKDCTVKVWSTESGECLQTLTGHTKSVTSVAWSHDGSKICSGGYDRAVKVWLAETGERLPSLTGHISTIIFVAWSYDGSKICSGSYDKTVKVWLAETGECLQTLRGHTGGVKSVAWSYDGSKICSSSEDKTVKVWLAETGECLQTLVGHTKVIKSIAWNHDGSKICSSSEDKTVKIWLVESGECLQTLIGHANAVTCTAWNYDGSKICSGSYDKTVKVWLAESGECLQTLRGHTRVVKSVAWSYDGSKICSGSYDRTVKVWLVESGEFINTRYNFSRLSLQNWQLLEQKTVTEPVVCELGVQNILYDATHRRAFAWIGSDHAAMHPVHVLGGSGSSNADLDFLLQNRVRACNYRMQAEFEAKEATQREGADLEDSSCARPTVQCSRCKKGFCETSGLEIKDRFLCVHCSALG